FRDSLHVVAVGGQVGAAKPASAVRAVRVGYLVQRDGDLEVLARPVVRAADTHYPAAGENLELLAGTDVGRHGDAEGGHAAAAAGLW
ncbi:hypothetical protein THAOC_27564, partial [Thalassiosira oceanica]